MPAPIPYNELRLGISRPDTFRHTTDGFSDDIRGRAIAAARADCVPTVRVAVGKIFAGGDDKNATEAGNFAEEALKGTAQMFLHEFGGGAQRGGISFGLAFDIGIFFEERQ